MTKFDKVMKEINDLWLLYQKTEGIRRRLRKKTPKKKVRRRDKG